MPGGPFVYRLEGLDTERPCAASPLHVDGLDGALMQRVIMCTFGGAEGENTIVYCVNEGVAGAEVGHVGSLPLLAEPLTMRGQSLILDLLTARLVPGPLFGRWHQSLMLAVDVTGLDTRDKDDRRAARANEPNARHSILYFENSGALPDRPKHESSVRAIWREICRIRRLQMPFYGSPVMPIHRKPINY